MIQAHSLTKVISSLCIALSLWLSFTGLTLAQGPTITTTDPVTNEVGVALTHTISLTYSQAISPATIHTGTVVAQGMMGGLITGTYSVSGVNATLTPARPFFPNEIVRTTATSSTQNLGGDGAAPYQWQFTAGVVTDRCVAGFSDINAGLTGMHDSSAAWGDYDNDGDLDILLSGWDRGGNPMTQVWRNDGDSFSDTSAGLTGMHDSSVVWGDYDNDGDLDILLSGADSGFNLVTQVWRNDGGSFTNISAGLTGVNYSNVAWGDYDNDGDLDILLSGADSGYNPVTQVWRNDGGSFTNISAGLTGVNYSNVAWGDYDNDGDLDILLSGWASGHDPVTQVWRNDGGSFTNISAGLTGVTFGSTAWGDYDNDGDLDILLSGQASGSGGPVTQIWRNEDCPLAKAGPNQTVTVDTLITLDGSASSNPNGNTLNYGWRQTAGPAVSFTPNLSVTTFTAPLTPTLLTFSLTITTGEGYTATDSTVITVTDSAITGLNATNDSPTQLGNPTTFTATVTGGTNVSYSWAFGDGNSGSGANPGHTYLNAGTYTATITATNSLGALNAATVVSIYEPTAPSTYTLTVTTVGSGTVSLNPPGGVYAANTTVTLTAIPDSGWTFTGWAGDLSGGTASLPLLMDSHKAVTATFDLLDNGHTLYLPLVVR